MKRKKDIEKRLRSLEARLHIASQIIENMMEGLIILDENLKILGVNSSFCNITGLRGEDIIGRKMMDLDLKWEGFPTFGEVLDIVQEEGVWRGEVWGVHTSGTTFSCEAVIRRVNREKVTYIVLFSDSTDRRSLEASLTSLSYYDPVTGLPNRALLREHLSGAVSRARNSGKMVGVIFIDLDNFKLINDSLGHEIGDRLLKEFSARMISFFQSATMVSRFGGDEFVIVVEYLEGTEALERLLRSFLESVSHPFHIEGRKIYVTVSAGISLFPVDGSDPNTLIRNADMAMHHAKDMGRNSYRFFTEDLNLKVNERFTIELRLREAIGKEEFALFYQPQFELSSGKVTGVEALIRWVPSGTDVIGPSRFIHVAEETDLIIPIGEWVLRKACADGKKLWDMGYRLRVGVNISAKQLSYVDLISLIDEILTETGFDPHYLDLEITESALMSNKTRARDILLGLKDMGVTVSIDDFGTSYSSLNYLKYFPVDRLKIDRSFIGDIITDPNDVAIATTIIAIAHNLGLKAVAEGVETEEQLTFLKLWQCDEAQGFLFSPPVSFENLIKILGERRISVNDL